MSKKRFAKVSVSIWNDGKFQGLSTEAKLIFLFFADDTAQDVAGACSGTQGGDRKGLRALKAAGRQRF